MVESGLSGRLMIDDNGMLTINDLLLQDSGIFQCVASNSVGESTVYTWLRVRTTKPVLKVPPQNATIYDGKDVQMTCEADGAPRPNVTWYHDGNLIHSIGRIQVLESGALLIAAAQPSDNGNYTCVQKNSEGEAQGTAFLAVRVRTQITQPPVDTKVILGNTATLQCRVSHDANVEYELQWIYRGEAVPTKSPSGRIQILKDGTLEIREARNTDIGEYRCVVHSPGGNDTRTAKIDVVG